MVRCRLEDLVDSYLLPFQSCVEKGKVSGLMCRHAIVVTGGTCAMAADKLTP